MKFQVIHNLTYLITNTIVIIIIVPSRPLNSVLKNTYIMVSGYSSDEEVWDDPNDEDLSEDLPTTDAVPSVPVFEDNSIESYRVFTLLLWTIGITLSIQTRYYIPDAAMNKLFHFLYILIAVLGHISPFLARLVNKMPKSSLSARKLLGLTKCCQKFVICPKCWTLYTYEEAMEIVGSIQKTKLCNFIEFPNHSQQSRRVPCRASLLKTVELVSGRKILYPYKLFCYKSLQSTMQEFLLRPGFHQECEHWRIPYTSNLLKQVYDGKVWKDFLHVDGSPFLALPFTYALTLNVDWFQPYSHTMSSVGVIYLSIMNLPRHKWYKRKNKSNLNRTTPLYY